MDKKFAKKLYEVYKRNDKLMQQEDINTLGQLFWGLGDHYSDSRRKHLLLNLSPDDAKVIREYYLRHCPDGMDRTPTCLKIILKYDSSSVWRSNRETVTAELDRVEKSVVFSYKDQLSNPTTKVVTFGDDFEDHVFFELASRIRQCVDGAVDYSTNGNKIHIECHFADDIICSYDGVSLERKDFEDEGMNTFAELFYTIMQLFDEVSHYDR